MPWNFSTHRENIKEKKQSRIEINPPNPQPAVAPLSQRTMASAEDFKSVQEGLQKSLVSAVKTANRIAGEDLGFQRTINPEVAELLDQRSSQLLDLSTRLLRSAANAFGLKSPRLEDVEDIDLNWRRVVDVVDTVLEKADTALDEYTGLIKRKEPPTTEPAPASKRPKATGKVIRNAHIAKPQLLFELQPDNFPTTPWKPLLTDKPHAKVPLAQSLVTFKADNGTEQYRHPYEAEIKSIEFPDHVFQKTTPTLYQPMDETNAIFVDTFEGVLEMLEQLKQANEIAVDLEHHDFRTYTGLVSLMQISTRTQDWIVDTLKPWRHKLQVLNQVFADPSILKVFHGAHMDIIWLQRDLGLYINGTFDTYFACALLMYQSKSLAFLLSKFVNFDADKQYQLADWRLRPLPEEMLYYARSDTHFLLYIYDCLRNELIASSNPADPDGNLLQQVLQKSQDQALSRHEHATFDPETGRGARGWYGYVLKQGHLAFREESFAVFRALWKWRDDTARKEDDSPNYVLGNHVIVEVAKLNPPDKKALHSLLPGISPYARPRLDEIWRAMQEAKEKGGPTLLQFLSTTAPEYMGHRAVLPESRWTASLPTLEGDIHVGKLAKSQLFGSVPISSRWESVKRAPPNQDDRVPFPWQRYVEAMMGQDGVIEEPLVPEEEPQAPAQVPDSTAMELSEDQSDEEEFTLKRGKKRKSALEPDDTSSSEDDSDDGDGDDGNDAVANAAGENKDEEESLSKEADSTDEAVEIGGKGKKRKNKKVKESTTARKARKEQEKKNSESKDVQPRGKKERFNAVPFDYSQASSVMNASRRGESGDKAQAARKPVFDPYAKASESDIKGARKAMPVRGEKSGTFKK